MSDRTMRAKMKVSAVGQGQGFEEVQFTAVGTGKAYPEDGSDEDNTFAKFTPSASASFVIATPALHGKFEIGDTFYVDFTRAEKKD